MIMVEILTNMHRQDLTPRPPKFWWSMQQLISDLLLEPPGRHCKQQNVGGRDRLWQRHMLHLCGKTGENCDLYFRLCFSMDRRHSVINMMTGRHWDNSKRLLAALNTKLCGFWGEGSYHGGCSQISPEHPGFIRGFWNVHEFIIVTQARRTFYGFKKLLGRKVGDPRVTEEMARWARGCQNSCGISISSTSGFLSSWPKETEEE